MQVRIEGSVHKVSTEESDAYFGKRPRGSQLGAWASQQSQEVSSREAMDRAEQDVAERFKDTEVIPRPLHWGGYRLVPRRIEFWKVMSSFQFLLPALVLLLLTIAFPSSNILCRDGTGECTTV